MIPKEKAKELFNKFCYAIRTEETDSGYFTNVLYAKNCALIAVDEIINSVVIIDFTITENQFIYWGEVKQEIEKL
jgi:hypothetical protein